MDSSIGPASPLVHPIMQTLLCVELRIAPEAVKYPANPKSDLDLTILRAKETPGPSEYNPKLVEPDEREVQRQQPAR